MLSLCLLFGNVLVANAVVFCLNSPIDRMMNSNVVRTQSVSFATILFLPHFDATVSCILTDVPRHEIYGLILLQETLQNWWNNETLIWPKKWSTDPVHRARNNYPFSPPSITSAIKQYWWCPSKVAHDDYTFELFLGIKTAWYGRRQLEAKCSELFTQRHLCILRDSSQWGEVLASPL